MEVQLTESDNGWVVKVGQQYQPFDPDLPGFVPMTFERAVEVAKQLRTSLEVVSETPTE